MRKLSTNISFPDLSRETQGYFIENIFSLSQADIKNLHNEMILLCNKEISVLTKPEAVPVDVVIEVKDGSKMSLWVYKKILKKLKKYNEKCVFLMKRRISLLNEIKDICSACIRSNETIEIVPKTGILKTSKHIKQIKEETTAIANKIILLQNYLSSKTSFIIPSTPSNELESCIEYLVSISHQQSRWFPKCAANDRMEFFIKQYMKFDISNSSNFLPCIMNNALTLVKFSKLSEDFLPACYLLCYRVAFDLVYPQFLTSCIDYNFTYKRQVKLVLSDKSNEMIAKGEEILESILFETNPIDIGYQINSLSTIVANIYLIEEKERGREKVSFIAADQCIHIIQYLLYKSQFTYAVHILPIFDKFCMHKDYPVLFKYACQNFKIAVLDLLNE